MARKPPKGKSFYELHPSKAKEWHYQKNVGISPQDVTAGSNKKVWWKCATNPEHEWEARVDSRSAGRGCPSCGSQKRPKKNMSLADVNPTLAQEWSPKNNGLTPYDVSIGSNKKVWWKCSKGVDHEWESSPNNRSKAGCPVCANKKAVISNSLGTNNPDLATEWHPKLNGSKTPFNYTPISGVKVWWLCNKNNKHAWEASIAHRANGRGCPYCLNKKIGESNSLGFLHPEIAREWNQQKNGSVTPDMVAPVSGKKYWWKCPRGEDHVWQSSVANRTRGRACPICTGHKVVPSTSLPITHPKIFREWHPDKNKGVNPNLVSKGTEISVWWLCGKNPTHEWKAMIYSRTYGIGCPFCVLTPQSRQELQISFELQQFFKIDPKGFKTRVNGKLWSIDIYLSELNLGIEFDGSYWHKEKRVLDKLKTKQLQDDGFQIMRIREEPLKPITDIDVVSKLPFNAKDVVDDVLRHIMDTYTLDQKKIDLIKLYLRKSTLQNEQGLEDYIEQILTEKAERKQNK